MISQMVTSLDKFHPQMQAQLASLVAGGGLVWAAKVGTSTRLGVAALVNTPGVVELLCGTILVWLVAKLRSVERNRTSTRLTADGAVGG